MAAADPRDLDDVEWPLRATELHALLAWLRGSQDRAGFRRVLRGERWPENDIDDLCLVLEHVMATDARMPIRRGGSLGG